MFGEKLAAGDKENPVGRLHQQLRRVGGEFQPIHRPSALEQDLSVQTHRRASRHPLHRMQQRRGIRSGTQMP